jgi:hypothetical protein
VIPISNNPWSLGGIYARTLGRNVSLRRATINGCVQLTTAKVASAVIFSDAKFIRERSAVMSDRLAASPVSLRFGKQPLGIFLRTRSTGHRWVRAPARNRSASPGRWLARLAAASEHGRRDVVFTSDWRAAAHRHLNRRTFVERSKS